MNIKSAEFSVLYPSNEVPRYRYMDCYQCKVNIDKNCRQSKWDCD